MSFFDDALKDAVPGGDLTTPIAIAAGALLLHHFLSSSSTPAPTPQASPTQAPAPGGFLGGGGLFGGLSDLVGKLTSNGAGPQVNSWVGNGANTPIAPGQLGTALGQPTLEQLSAKTGLSQQELLAQLSAMLPQLVNKLTPNGRMPTQAELQSLGH